MKDIIINVLENLQVVKLLDEVDAINISIYNEAEYFDVADTNYSDAHEVWGDFNYVLMFSDHPDYCFISNDMSIVKINDTITKWLEELEICNH